MTDVTQPESTEIDLGQLIDRLTPDQVRFVVSRQEHSKDKEAAEAIEISPATVKKWKYDGAPIDDAVKAMAMDGLIVARKIRRRNLAKAMLVKVKGLDSSDEKVRQGVATEIIEWEDGKATQKQVLTGQGGGPLVIEVEYIQQVAPSASSAASSAEASAD